MLTQVLSTLQNLGVQGVPTSIPHPPPHAPAGSNAAEHNGQQLKRTGYESPPTQETTIRHKRPDTKTTPDKPPDF
jgi:hypothetical protein